MDFRIAGYDKCRICLAPDSYVDFIQLKGTKAEMFREAIGVKLTIDGVKSKSVICQNCFRELERLHDFKAKGIRAYREYFEIQRKLAATQRATNEPAQAADEVQLPEAATIEPYSPSRIKRKWVKLVQLTKFDAKWPNDSTMFQKFLTCKHCRLVVKHQGNLTRHLRACSRISARFEYGICGERIQKKSLMGRHMQKHSNKRNLRCRECGKGLKGKDTLMGHKRSHDKPFACSTCQKKFAVNRTLKLHQMQHRHGIYATEESFGCDKCDKTFLTPKYLKRHQSVVHNEKADKCGICGKISKNRAYLLQHIRINAKVECSICHKKISKPSMASHVRSHSSHFECDLCNHSTNTKSSLKDHIERKHALKSSSSSSLSSDVRQLLPRRNSSATCTESLS